MSLVKTLFLTRSTNFWPMITNRYFLRKVKMKRPTPMTQNWKKSFLAFSITCSFLVRVKLVK